MLIDCNYITPCGWCEKWDKKCDLKKDDDVGRPLPQDKNKCKYYNNGCCMGTKEKEACNLNIRGISYCDRYKEN